MSRQTRADLISDLQAAQSSLREANQLLREARNELADTKSELARLRDYAGKQYLAGMENQRRITLERAEYWISQTQQVFGQKKCFKRMMAVVRIAVDEEILIE